MRPMAGHKQIRVTTATTLDTLRHTSLIFHLQFKPPSRGPGPHTHLPTCSHPSLSLSLHHFLWPSRTLSSPLFLTVFPVSNNRPHSYPILLLQQDNHRPLLRGLLINALLFRVERCFSGENLSWKEVGDVWTTFEAVLVDVALACNWRFVIAFVFQLCLIGTTRRYVCLYVAYYNIIVLHLLLIYQGNEQ